MTIAAALAWATAQLRQKQIADPRLEAEILLSHILTTQRIKLIINDSQPLTPQQWQQYRRYVRRRQQHEPTAYIVGYQSFLSFNFVVNRSVLIPRPETEQLVELALKMLVNQTQPKVVVDLGTGSGVIAICLAKLAGVMVIGLDQSAAALRVARKNAVQFRVTKLCRFRQGNLFEPLKEKADLIVSNPPYVPKVEFTTLQPEVRDWEPRQALSGGSDGMRYIKTIIRQAPGYLKPGGRLLLEFGTNQAESITGLAKDYFTSSKIMRDHAGTERFFLGWL